MSAPVITVMVASHKSYVMPEDKMYMPLQVGAEGKPSIEGFTRDDSGDNISAQNYRYSELTALYWGWHNLTQSDFVGLVHYRRLFRGDNGALTYDEASRALSNHKLIVPRKRRYYIETLYSHYVHTHAAEELDKARDIIKWIYPDYLSSFDKAINRTWGYMFNMMIMPQQMLDSYCSWLFNVLGELIAAMDDKDMSDFDKRYPGRIAELLFNCWIQHQIDTEALKRSDICEVPFMYTEKVNKFKKAWGFLMAKFAGKKQEKSI